MKQVEIIITGDILALDYCSQKLYDEENGFIDNYYLTCGWQTITGLYVNPKDRFELDNEENVVKKKGKYIKTKEYFHNLFKEDGEHPLPVDIHARIYYLQNVPYIVELEDDEEFDIKKLQLLKSDYEIECCPYFIIADYILYNGVEMYSDEASDYCPEEKIHDEITIDGFCD